MNLMLVGKIDKKIIAQLFLQRSYMARLKHVGEVGLSVSKEFWGQSIGSQIMLCAIEWAREKHITKLQLQVRCDNPRAIGLYQRLGFSIEGTIMRSIKIESHYFDDYLMGLCL